MTNIPAFCDNCGNVFPSGLVIQNVLNITLQNNKSQCPKCHQMASVPDGIFNFYSDAIEILEASEQTVYELQKFFRILQQATENETNLQNKIKKEVPKLSFLAKFIPNDVKELAVYLTAIGTLIGIFTEKVQINTHIEINPHIEINQMIKSEDIYNQCDLEKENEE